MKKDLNKGLWDSSAAGHVDDGESYDDCAPRELQEELGDRERHSTPLFKLEPSPALGMEFIQVYACRHNGPFQPASEEIDETDWQESAEIDRRIADARPDLDPNLQNHLATLPATYRLRA